MTSASDKKIAFLDGKEIGVAITEVAALAARQKIRAALIGGAALQLHGSDRLTRDVDVIADVVPEGLTRVGALSFGGEHTVTNAGTPVDVIVRDDDFQTLYDAALIAAETVPGVALRVVPIEYLAAMKLAAGRPKDELDLTFILSQTNIDYPKTRALVKKHLGAYAAQSLDSFKSEADWKKTRG